MMTRRAILGAGLAGGALSTLTRTPVLAADPPAPAAGPIKLPPLPYAPDALEPHIDAQTMTIHHDKHHAGYVAKLNEAVGKLPGGGSATEADLGKWLSNLDSVPEAARTAVRNNGGGHFNHALFWESLSGKSSELKSGELSRAIDKSFNSRENLLTQMQDAGGKLFGSGWVWLVHDPKTKALVVTTTPNQDTPLAAGQHPLLGIDVWEHAYYLKYQNRRPEYLKAIAKVINWDVVAARFDKMA